jgi:hypothetical protein
MLLSCISPTRFIRDCPSSSLIMKIPSVNLKLKLNKTQTPEIPITENRLWVIQILILTLQGGGVHKSVTNTFLYIFFEEFL